MTASLLFELLLVGTVEAYGGVRHRPPEAHASAQEATDHVAIVEVNRGWGRPGPDRHIVTRSGSWLREERHSQGRAATSYSDLNSATTITHSPDSDGSPRTLSIERYPSSDTYHLYQHARTGEVESALGEKCEVWRTTRVRETPGAGVAWLNCLTEDGIELWSRAVSEQGTVLRSSRTVSFQRRDVQAHEVQPPRDLLDGWQLNVSCAARINSASVGSANGYTVRLEGATGSMGRASQVNRRLGTCYFSETGNDAGALHMTFDLGAVTGLFQAEAGGIPVRLSFYVRPQDQPPVQASYVRLEPEQSELVAGEECFWSRHGAIVISGSHRLCVTADGIPLRLISHHRVLIADLTARSLDRSPPDPSDFAPPEYAFDWAAWGIRLDE